MRPPTPRRRAERILTIALIAAVVAVAGVLAMPQFVAAGVADGGFPRSGGNQSLTLTDVSSLAEFKTAFNAASGSVRVVALMAPSCSICMAGTPALQRMLEDDHDANLKMFVVWMPVLVTDWARPSKVVLRRVSDPRARQFWDKTHVVSNAIKARAIADRPECCDKEGLLWDVVAVYPKDGLWEDTPPHAAFVNGNVVDLEDDLRSTVNALTR